MAIGGWWVMDTGAWVPAFAGMTVGGGENDGWGWGGHVVVWKWGVFVAIAGWWVVDTGVWVPAIAGMTVGGGE